MAYAIDILGSSFNKTKNLFFPFRLKYWMKMGFISLFSGNRTGGFGNSGYNTSSRDFGDVNFSQAMEKIKLEATNFLSQHGYILGIIIFVLFLILSVLI